MCSTLSHTILGWPYLSPKRHKIGTPERQTGQRAGVEWSIMEGVEQNVLEEGVRKRPLILLKSSELESYTCGMSWNLQPSHS